MKLRLLIATTDKEYCQRLSTVLCKNYANRLQADICSNVSRWEMTVSMTQYDCILVDGNFLAQLAPQILPTCGLTPQRLLLISGDDLYFSTENQKITVEKYQRVSYLVQELLPFGTSHSSTENQEEQGKVSAFWSPSGGTGTTTVALAYACKKAREKKVIYLDLDFFSSTAVYFTSQNKGMSWVFQQIIETEKEIHLEGIAETDPTTGIIFFGCPENYDDLNVLTQEHLERLLSSLKTMADEIVVDLPSACQSITEYFFQKSQRIYIITDTSASSKQKLQQFSTQHWLYSSYQEKMTVVSNKGALLHWEGKQLNLPLVDSKDDKVLFQTLASQSLHSFV